MYLSISINRLPAWLLYVHGHDGPDGVLFFTSLFTYSWVVYY